MRYNVGGLSSALQCCLCLLAFAARASAATTPLEMSELPDGTVSWEQPSDPAFGGYNGRCGETAIANIISMLLRDTSPHEIISQTSDLTPGTRPRTIEAFLQENAPGEWQTKHTARQWGRAWLVHALNKGAFKAANGKSPIVVLVLATASALHWTTVVDFDEDTDEVIVNEDKTQQRYDLATFLDHWGFVQARDGSAPRLVVNLCCYAYTFIGQVP